MRTIEHSEYGNDCMLYTVLVEIDDNVWFRFKKASGWGSHEWCSYGPYTVRELLDGYDISTGMKTNLCQEIYGSDVDPKDLYPNYGEEDKQ